MDIVIIIGLNCTLVIILYVVMVSLSLYLVHLVILIPIPINLLDCLGFLQAQDRFVVKIFIETNRLNVVKIELVNQVNDFDGDDDYDYDDGECHRDYLGDYSVDH